MKGKEAREDLGWDGTVAVGQNINGKRVHKRLFDRGRGPPTVHRLPSADSSECQGLSSLWHVATHATVRYPLTRRRRPPYSCADVKVDRTD